MNTREIKFRVWDKKARCWVSDYENTSGENRLKFFIDTAGKLGKIIYPLNGDDGSEDNIVDENNYIVLPYVGIDDKNGKNIYEDDIVKIWRDSSTNGVRDYETAVVVWDYNTWTVRISSTTPVKRRTELCFPNPDFLEVIGNLQQNPHMVRI